MSNILIQGIECLLASYFAARYLQAPRNHVYYLPEANNSAADRVIADRVAYALQRTANESGDVHPQKVEDRLHSIHETDSQGADIAALWYFDSAILGRDRRETSQLLLLCERLRIWEVNYVECDSLEGDLASGGEARISSKEIAQRCQAQGLRWRIFRAPLVAGAGRPDLEQSSLFFRFAAELHGFKAEVEERSPQYFDFQALRCLAPENAAVNLISAPHAAELLLRISERPATLDSDFGIVSPPNTEFADLCERLGLAYGLGLLPAHDTAELNAVDRSFHERVEGFYRYLAGRSVAVSNSEVYRAAGISPENLAFAEDEQITLFESIRRAQDELLHARKQHAEELPRRLIGKTIAASRGDLNYYVGGETGPAVVVLNALGQGLEYWYRLLDNLIGNHRVIIWEPRGTTAPPPPFGLADQVSDLDLILQHEAVKSCHLVGWCTGPKVAINFYLSQPAIVRSMVFLNITLKCDGSPGELDSPYEQNIESLCRILVRKPAMAATVMKTFQSRFEAGPDDALDSSDGQQVGISVLSQMNVNLRSYVLAPFKTEETTVNYAHQLIDFWSCDVRPIVAQVKAPVLLISAEYDQVATPDASREASRLFPNARHLHVKGATHYCLYDRAEFVADLLTSFFQDPEVFSALCSEAHGNLLDPGHAMSAAVTSLS
jgi:pimeloyl-ACP methyl ester carboxylesterase